jgi:ABC-type polysaccharide transport system, permease component
MDMMPIKTSRNIALTGGLHERYKLFLLSLPFVIFVLAFSYAPLFGWIYSFFSYRLGVPLFQNTFVGLQNFKEIISSTSDFGSIFINTIALSFLSILVSPLPIVFAIMIAEVRFNTYKKLVQTVTTLPNFMSWIVIYALFSSFFSGEGWLNQMLAYLGFDGSTNLLGNSDIAWYFQTAATLWKGLGWNAIIYLAAIISIDEELYDAAKMDGAGRFRVIWHITVPGVIPTYLVILLLSIGNMLSSNLDQYFVFYNPLVANKIEVIDYYAYRVGMLSADYSLGTAISMSKSFISIALLFSVNGLAGKLRGQKLF